MTIDEALKVREGDYVVSRISSSLKPRRVTRLWVNERRTIVQFWIHSLAGGGTGWIDSTAVELPPAGMKWNKQMSRWEPIAAEKTA